MRYIHSVPYIDKVIINCSMPLNMLYKAIFVCIQLIPYFAIILFCHAICVLLCLQLYTVSLKEKETKQSYEYLKFSSLRYR